MERQANKIVLLPDGLGKCSEEHPHHCYGLIPALVGGCSVQWQKAISDSRVPQGPWVRRNKRRDHVRGMLSFLVSSGTVQRQPPRRGLLLHALRVRPDEFQDDSSCMLASLLHSGAMQWQHSCSTILFLQRLRRHGGKAFHKRNAVLSDCHSRQVQHSLFLIPLELLWVGLEVQDGICYFCRRRCIVIFTQPVKIFCPLPAELSMEF